MISAPIKPTHKAIQAYYEKLEGYGAQTARGTFLIVSARYAV